MDSPYLTAQEVAELLRVNQQTVRNWITRGELTAIRVGGRRVRISQEDLEAFLAAKEFSGDAAANQAELRESLDQSLEGSRTALASGDDAELASSLRALAVAAMRRAHAVERVRRYPRAPDR
jgi:excisionase family DNA binding protein